MDKYYDISSNYFDLYELENKAYQPQCMTDFEYSTEYEKPNDLDLIILVYDRDLGRENFTPKIQAAYTFIKEKIYLETT